MDALLRHWTLYAPLAPILTGAVVYAVGMRRNALRRRARAQARWYAAGLLALVAALVSPLAAYDDRLFWAHMLQHVLLLAVAPPLLLLGRPAATSWRAFPLSYRRRTARAVAQSPRWAPLRAALRVLTAPPVALAVFVATMAAWHIPALYDTTLHSTAVHDLEHLLFFAAGLLFWSSLIDSPPLLSRLALPARAFNATVAMAACWLLAIVLGFASTPLYAYPTARPGGLSAIGDQHLAAGVMWVPGSLPFVVAAVLFAYRWLEPAVRRDTRTAVTEVAR